jgi:hypothetical protein
MPQCCFYVSEKLYRKYSRNWMKQSRTSYFSRHETKSKDETEGPGAGHTLGRRGLGLARAIRGWGRLVHLLTPPTTEGNLLLCSSYLALRVYQLVSWCQLHTSGIAIKQFFGAVAGEKEDFCKGSLSLPIFYFVIVCFIFIFTCIILSKI